MNAQQFQHQILCYSDGIYRMAKSILKDNQLSEDAYQDLMTRFWEKRNELETVTNKKAFMFTSMRNYCLDLLRKQKEQDEISLNTVYDAPNPHEITEQRDSVNHICRLIDQLPEMQRTILRMKDVEEMNIKEIATTMQITENAVTVNLSRARKTMREKIIANQQKEKLLYEQNR